LDVGQEIKLQVCIHSIGQFQVNISTRAENFSYRSSWV
jgi:hypothetical protein